MSNYLVRQGQKWSVKVSIPADVQHIFGKRAFKQTLKTSDKTVAIARSAPLIAQFKDAIEEARGNPTQHLDEYLAHTQVFLRKAKSDRDVDQGAIEGVQEEALDSLLKAYQPDEIAKLCPVALLDGCSDQRPHGLLDV